MAGSFARRRTVAGETVFRLGWCQGPDGAALHHCAVGPDEEPVLALDAAGALLPGFCPGSVTAAADTRNYKAGTVIYCQDFCHGDDQPEAWPGYGVAREATEVLALPDDEDDDEDPVLDIRLPAPADVPDGQSDAGDDEVPDDESDDLVASSDVTLEVETKRISYPSGSVARVEAPGLGRGGTVVTNVNWVAYSKDGERLGREWSLASAKKLLP